MSEPKKSEPATEGKTINVTPLPVAKENPNLHDVTERIERENAQHAEAERWRQQDR